MSSDFFRLTREAWRFARLPHKWRQIVFYSEGTAYTKYLRPVVDALLADQNMAVAYLTSDRCDPIFADPDKRIAAFCIGSGAVRTWVFQTLRAKVLVMSMPDLQSFHLKRSTSYPVHYTYLHHSLVSTHRIYRERAFDHFDSVLCAGPHHKQEIRAWEAVNRLPRKALFEHGYAPLDWLLDTAAYNPVSPTGAGLNVLLAPSWGPSGLLERGAEPIVDSLLQAGHRVVVRPHPMTMRLNSKALGALTKVFGAHPRFVFDANTATMQALLDAHVMVSDWSGVAMEFAFGLRRPVLFVDGPPKVNNPRWEEIGIPALEESYRSEVGALLRHDLPGDIPRLVEAIWANRHTYAARAETLRRKYVYNLGASGKAGARIIAELVQGRSRTPNDRGAERGDDVDAKRYHSGGRSGEPPQALHS